MQDNAPVARLDKMPVPSLEPYADALRVQLGENWVEATVDRASTDPIYRSWFARTAEKYGKDYLAIGIHMTRNLLAPLSSVLVLGAYGLAAQAGRPITENDCDHVRRMIDEFRVEEWSSRFSLPPEEEVQALLRFYSSILFVTNRRLLLVGFTSHRLNVATVSHKSEVVLGEGETFLRRIPLDPEDYDAADFGRFVEFHKFDSILQTNKRLLHLTGVDMTGRFKELSVSNGESVEALCVWGPGLAFTLTDRSVLFLNPGGVKEYVLDDIISLDVGKKTTKTLGLFKSENVIVELRTKQKKHEWVVGAGVSDATVLQPSVERFAEQVAERIRR